jgi:hypothetical protein
MSALGKLTARLAGAGRAVVFWVDDVAKARRELAEVYAALRETERLLSEQISLNGRLITRQSWDAAGGAK